jgi:nicotinamidase-related amidase
MVPAPITPTRCIAITASLDAGEPESLAERACTTAVGRCYVGDESLGDVMGKRYPGSFWSKWLVEESLPCCPFEVRMPSVNLRQMRKPALLVIDMLNDFLAGWQPEARRRLARSIDELVETTRSVGHPVVWIRQEFDPDLRDAFPEMRAKNIAITIKGTAGCEIIPELRVLPTDSMIIKKRYSAFYNTVLDETLGRLKPDSLIVAGINTHACIRMTAIDAYQRDWPVILAADCIDSYDREHHEISLKYLRGKMATVMTNEEIRAAMASPRA